MKEKLKKEEVGFAQVKNDILYSSNISFKAKGLYSYLYSKPDDWDFSSERIALETKDGVDSVKTGLKELEDVGLLTRMKTKTGRVEYCIYCSIEPKKPKVENPTKGKSHKGKIHRISNKDNIQTKNNTNKEDEGSSVLIEPPRETYKTKSKVFHQKGLEYTPKKKTDAQEIYFNADSLGRYYLDECQRLYGYKPAFSYAKAGKNYAIAKRRLQEYSLQDCKNFVTYHLSSDSELGTDFSICLSDHVINKYLKNNKKTNEKLKPHW